MEEKKPEIEIKNESSLSSKRLAEIVAKAFAKMAAKVAKEKEEAEKAKDDSSG